VSVSLQLSLYNIILTITFLTGVGNHWCHCYNLRIFIHFFPVGFLYPHQIERNLLDIFYILILHIFFLPDCRVIKCLSFHLSSSAISLLFEFKFSNKHVFQSNNQFQIDEIKRRNKSLQECTFFDLNIEFFPYYMENSHTLHIHSIFFVFDCWFEWLDLELLCSCSRYFNIDIFVKHHWNVVELSSIHFFTAIDLQL